MPTLQQQARALGDPSRHEAFRYIAEASQPVDVAELTDHLGLNHNAIRQHLAKLVDAGLVLEGTAPTSGRGRPRLTYVLNPSVESRWGGTGPYERLALWLAEMVRSGDGAVEVGRRAGRHMLIGTVENDGPVAALADQMARHGFGPTTRQRGTDAVITLYHCPFESTALADSDTVCALHLGMAHGIAENLPGLVVDSLVPKDPRVTKCEFTCHVERRQRTDHPTEESQAS